MPDVEVSVAVATYSDNLKHVKNLVNAIRQEVGASLYEIVIIDGGSSVPIRRWLSEQGDVVLLGYWQNGRPSINDATRMARGKRLYGWNGVKLVKISQKAKWPKPTPLPPLRPLRLPPPKPSTAKPPEPMPIILWQNGRERILMVSSLPSNTLGIQAALSRVGHTIVFGWLSELKQFGKEVMNERLIRAVRQFVPTLIFIEEHFTGDILPETIRFIKGILSVAVVDWNGDLRETLPQSMIDIGREADWVFISNKTQLPALKALSINAEFVPAGCHPEVYKPVTPNLERYPADIIFLGSGNRKYPNSALREKMVWALYERYGDRFRVYGRGWRKKSCPFVYDFLEPQELEAEAYSSCKIAVGISEFNYIGYTSGRMWKAMGSGAFYMPYYFPELDKWFRKNDDLVWWETLNELTSAIDYYLQDETARKAVATSGQRKVHAEHSWDARIADMLRMIKGRPPKQARGSFDETVR